MDGVLMAESILKMTCHECGKPEVSPAAGTVEKRMFGIPVKLELECLRCASCGAEAIHQAHIERVEHDIALLLLLRETLDGDAAKFVRKFLGFSRSQVAELTQCQLEHVKEWESNGQAPASFMQAMRRNVLERAGVLDRAFGNVFLAEVAEAQRTVSA